MKKKAKKAKKAKKVSISTKPSTKSSFAKSSKQQNVFPLSFRPVIPKPRDIPPIRVIPEAHDIPLDIPPPPSLIRHIGSKFDIPGTFSAMGHKTKL